MCKAVFQNYRLGAKGVMYIHGIELVLKSFHTLPIELDHTDYW